MNFRIVRLETTPSTMIEARNCEPGTVVVAREQTAGMGRMGRQWHSPRDTGLYCSLVLEPPCSLDKLPVVTLALGLACQQAIQQLTGLVCDLRWPNDLLIAGKKCGGILVELHEGRLIAGIGINVNQTEFPAELTQIATSLRLVSGREHSVDELLGLLLKAVEEHLNLLRQQGPEPILRLFTQCSSYARGRRVQVGQLRGITDGLDPCGFLWLRTTDGRRILIRSGDLRPIEVEDKVWPDSTAI